MSNLMNGITTRDRFRGCLMGLAAGDALGTTLEFKRPGSFQTIDDMVGGGPFGLEPGQWTDDTSMALCLAASLIECGELDATDQMRRYVRWRLDGSPVAWFGGRPAFDIGNTVMDALSRFQRTGNPYAGSTDQCSAGNGSLMRLAPAPMYFSSDAMEAIVRSADSSRTTHGAEEAVDACRYFAGLLVGALNGVDKDTLLSPRYCPVEGLWETSPLSEKIAAVGEDRRRRRRIVQAPRASGNQGNGLRRRIAGGGPVGVPQVQRVPRRRPARGQSRRRRGHNRRDLRPDRGRVLWI